METHGSAVWVQVNPAAGMVFAGTGVGWTSPTHAIPMCHPSGVGRFVICGSASSKLGSADMSNSTSPSRCTDDSIGLKDRLHLTATVQQSSQQIHTPSRLA